MGERGDGEWGGEIYMVGTREGFYIYLCSDEVLKVHEIVIQSNLGTKSTLVKYISIQLETSQSRMLAFTASLHFLHINSVLS